MMMISSHLISPHLTSLNRNQKACMEFSLVARPTSIYIPDDDGSVHFRCWRLVSSTPFEYLVMFVIVLNTIALTLDVYDPPKSYGDGLGYLNIFFTGIFFIEMVLKVCTSRNEASQVENCG